MKIKEYLGKEGIMGQKIVVIGGVACGPKAAARLKRLDPSAEVIILDQGPFVSYGACGLPFFLGGVVKELQELINTPAGVPRDPHFFKAVKDIEVLTRTKAEAIDRDKKIVVARQLETGEILKLPYDSLVLATGSSPIRPPLEGIDLAGIYTLKTLEDGRALKEALANPDIRDVVVVGLGLIALECIEALFKAHKRITVVEKLHWPLPTILDEDVAFPLKEALEDRGIEIILGEGVKAFEGRDRVEKVITEGGREIPCQMVLLSIGVRPNVDLAREAGLEVGPLGIKVDRHLRTSDPHIYAGGDCVESRCLISGKPVYLPMGSVANKHGRVIGDNLAGMESVFEGVVATAVCRLFDLNIARTGLTEKRAREMGYDVVSTIVAGSDRAHYIPGQNPLLIKLIADAASGRVLGAQMIGPGDVLPRVNTVAAVLRSYGTIEDLAAVEMAYAPPFAPAIDLLTTAAWATQNKIYRLVKSYKPYEVKAKIDRGEEVILLDVRTPKEVEAVKIPYPNVVYIPLGKLRALALEKLPRQKEIISFCKISLRGFEAARILASLGFPKVAYMEGGLAAWPFEKEFGL